MLALTLLVLASCPWSFCQPRESETNRPVRPAEVAATAWAIASAPGDLVVEPACTAYPKLACDWTDREAEHFIFWRDHRLHGPHEDRKGLFCESSQLWTTWLPHDTEAAFVSSLGGYVLYRISTRACEATAGPYRPPQLECHELRLAQWSVCLMTTEMRIAGS